jgi:enterochelin esterase family protein
VSVREKERKSMSRAWAMELRAAMTLWILMMGAAGAMAQPRAQGSTTRPATTAPTTGFASRRPPAFASPHVTADRRVTLRIYAPKAGAARVWTMDLPGSGFRPREMNRSEAGVWELTLGPIDPGTYRYAFDVDGVTGTDPRNQAVSESNGTVWSVMHVPGSDFMDELDVPHGAVAAVHYRSTALGGRTRRMHVYTPPGYEAGGTEKYPVLYLLHGAADSDDSWTSVGRANFILDNLIAAKKARPMIVVMPMGHTGPFSFTAPPPPRPDGKPSIGAEGFEDDFVKDIWPYIESHYRVQADQAHRAIAGLSMGGAQTLDIATPRLEQFGYIGVFSSGIVFRSPADFEKQYQSKLEDASARNGVHLMWFSTGSQDFLLNQTRQTVALFERHGFQPEFHESEGGHTWINWQQYLNAFAPLLFR